MTLILAVDVGNTRAKFGLFEVGHAAKPQVRDISAVRLADVSNVATEIERWLDDGDCDGVGCDGVGRSIVAGSNPPARDEVISNWPWPDQPPAVISHHSDVPVRADVDEPASVGIDRLLTAYAVRNLFARNQPVIVIDSGTATTVNLVTVDGTFRGGAILPGLRLSAYALHDYTARLPLVDTEQLSSGPSDVDAPLPGRNTTEAMKSGLFWGQLGAIRELSQRLANSAVEDFGNAQPPLYVLTGGGGRQLVGHLSDAVYIDSLALHGLALLAARE